MQRYKSLTLESNLCVQRLRSIEAQMISLPPPDGIADPNLIQVDQMTLIDLEAAYGARVARDAIMKTNKLWNPLKEFGQSWEPQRPAVQPLSFCYDPDLSTKLEVELSKISDMIDRYMQHNAVASIACQAQAVGTVDSASTACPARHDAMMDSKYTTTMLTADNNACEPAAVDLLPSRRRNMDDPCFKVLPYALRQRGIKAPWTHYDLYIIHDDGEQCCGLWEKSLQLFKGLDKAGKNPRFDMKVRDMPHSLPAPEVASKDELDGRRL